MEQKKRAPDPSVKASGNVNSDFIESLFDRFEKRFSKAMDEKLALLATKVDLNGLIEKVNKLSVEN
jgi:predicted TPR repeat methyltransferase